MRRCILPKLFLPTFSWKEVPRTLNVFHVVGPALTGAVPEAESVWLPPHVSEYSMISQPSSAAAAVTDFEMARRAIV